MEYATILTEHLPASSKAVTPWHLIERAWNSTASFLFGDGIELTAICLAIFLVKNAAVSIYHVPVSIKQPCRYTEFKLPRQLLITTYVPE